MNTQVAPLNASWDAYIRHGWYLVPIPKGTKGPTTPGWNKKENCLTIGSNLPPDFGVGLAHAYSGTMALDIDHWELAEALLKENDIDLNTLYNALDAVAIDSGREGRGKLIYAMPFGIVMPTKKITQMVDGVNKTILEFRCASNNGTTAQDVLPPSTHPQTLRPYQWKGNGHWTRLPLLPASLLDMWDKLVKKDSEKVIRVVGTANASWDEVRSALQHISPDCSRDVWIEVLMALQSAGVATGDPDTALAIADEWSSGSATKYKGSQDVAYQMSTLKADGGITLGTLFHHAREGGWVKAMPDVSDLFKDVTPRSASEIFDFFRPKPPTLNLDIFPTILSTRVKELAVSAGIDPIIPLFAALASISGAIDTRCRLRLGDGYYVHPILWLMIIGESGTKKSPGSKPFFGILNTLEQEDLPSFKKRLLEWEVREKLHESAKKEYIAHCSGADALLTNTVAPSVPDLPPQPKPLRILVSDITSQRLGQMCGENPRGLVCQLDEMKTWTDKIANSNSGEGRSTWVESYEGGVSRVDRISAESFYVDNLAVSIYGNIQPEVLKDKIINMGSDGALQRFIPGVVDPLLAKPPANIPEMLTNSPQWDMMIRKLFALEKQDYELSFEAQMLFKEFSDWHHWRTQDNHILGEPPVFCGAFAKLEGTLGRLTLIMHLLTDPYSKQVSKETLSNAIEFIKGYALPAFRYTYGEIVGLFNASLEKWCMEYILQVSDHKETITLSELKISARRKLEKKTSRNADDEIGNAMDYLETADWVKELESSRRDRRIWAINPMVARCNVMDRKRVIIAKQRKLDEVWHNMLKTNPDTPRQFAKHYELEWGSEL